MFDFTPLTTPMLVWAALAFAASYFAIHQLVQRRWLRTVTVGGRVYYGGAMVVALTILFAALPLRNMPGLLLGLVAAGAVTLVGGIWDEIRPLRPFRQLLLQLIAAACVVTGGWTIHYISQPFGAGVIAFAPLVGGVLAVAWLLLLMNAMNWLDGVDGLSASVGGVALVTLAAVSLLPSVQDSLTLSLSLVGVGVVGGFLLWNWSPARVYLGTSGSWWLGLFIGAVAIAGGGKIVTTLLVLALPVVDVVLVVVARMRAGHPLWQGDTMRHAHHRLLAHGLSPRVITSSAALVTALLGAAAVTLQTEQKIIALAVAAVFFAIMIGALALAPVRERWMNPKLVSLALLALLIVGLVVSFSPKPCRNFTEGTVTVGDTEWSVAIADTPAEHKQGLMECELIPDKSGMYFVFTQPSTQPFWMKDMRVPLDIIWIAEGEIVGLERNVPIAGDEPNPPLYYSPQPYTAVLELPAGEADKSSLIIGSKVTLERE